MGTSEKCYDGVFKTRHPLDYFVALVKEAAATLEKESLLGLHYSQDEGERIFFHHQAVFAATQALNADDMKELNKAFAIAKKGDA